MANRDCPICNLGDERLALESVLWKAGSRGALSDERIDNVISLAKMEKPHTASYSDIRLHMDKHIYYQPEHPGPLMRRRVMQEWYALSERDREFLRSVSRVRIVSTRIAWETFYRAGAASSIEPTRGIFARVNRELDRLSRGWFLYRYRPEKKGQTWPRFHGKTIWTLGPAAAIAIAIEQGRHVPMASTKSPDDFDQTGIIHDLACVWMYTEIYRHLNDTERTWNGMDGRIYADTHAWWGARNLHMGWWDASRGRYRDTVPDGFGSVSFEVPENEFISSGIEPLIVHNELGFSHPNGSDSLPIPLSASTSMPFFLEYDRGTKIEKEVAQQLLSYRLMAQGSRGSNAFKRLLPELDGVPPVYFIFARQQSLVAVREHVKRLVKNRNDGLHNLPIYMTTQDLLFRSLNDERTIIHAWKDMPAMTFFESLVMGSKTAIRQPHLVAHYPFKLDTENARRVTGGRGFRTKVDSGEN